MPARRKPNTEEAEALAVLARRGRVLAILVPDGIAATDIEELSRRVNAELDRLVARRGKRRADA